MFKAYAGIDYDFRPKSYWAEAPDPLAAILRNVKGRRRREMIRDYYVAGKLDELCNELLNDSLDDRVRESLGRIHPTFMGGEYLPKYSRREVEIARIQLESTAADVISLRARGSRSRIEYRLVDENQTEFCLPEHTSREPFSLRELISFLDSAEHYGGDPEWHRFGFVLSFNECNLDCAQDADLETLDDLHDFTSISSDFYPGLSAHYGQVIEEWYSVREREIQEERNNPEPMLRRTLARVEKHWGPEHVSIVPHLIALAQRLKDTNQFAEVELLFRRVRAIEEKHYGRKVSALPPDWNDGCKLTDALKAYLISSGNAARAEQFRRDY